MQPEWPFSARSDDSRTGCAKAEAPRLLGDVTDAFVDRRPIDWGALLARVHGSRDRALFENLCLLDRLRRAGRAPGADRDPPPPLAVRLLIVLTFVQTGLGLGIAGVVFVSGDGVLRGPQIVLAAAFAAAAAMLGAASRDPRGLLLAAVMGSAASAFARAAATPLPETYPTVLAYALRGLYPEALMPACLWQLARDFPRVRRFTAFDVLARRIAQLAWTAGTIVFILNLAAAYRIVDPAGIALLVRNDPGNGFWYLFCLMSGPAVAAIALRARRAGPEERHKVRRFAVAFAAGTAPFLVSALMRLTLPGFDRWLSTAGPGERGWLDRLIITSLVATPVLGTAALIVDRPFELRALSRARFVRGALIAAMAAPFAWLLATIYGLRHLPIAEVFAGPRGWVLFGCAAAGGGLLLIRERLFGALDRRGFRSPDHQQRLAGALERLRTARGGREIGVVLARELRRGVGAATVRVLVPAADGGFADPAMEISPLGAATLIVALLRDTTQLLDVSGDRRLRTLLPHLEREWLTANDVELAAALKHGDGTIAAIVVLGAKAGQARFTRRDRWLVSSLTAGAAAAWDAEDGRGTREGEAGFECPRCGRVAASRPVPCECTDEPVLASLPRHLGGKFIVERRIGAGGMGVVYLARDTALDREVALKTLPSLRERTVARLRDEARVMAGLNHESLATLYGLELWRRTPVLVVEYLPGGTLERKLAATWPVADTAALGISLARALTYMHAIGVLHRDLKPSNIGFSAAGLPKLLDFGLGGFAGPAHGGTPAYMPPEAFEGAPPSPAFDLWALAVVLLETSCRRDRDRCPIALRPFFARALAQNPGERFQTAGDVLSALEDLQNADVTQTFPS
jgi:hypothetical protein